MFVSVCLIQDYQYINSIMLLTYYYLIFIIIFCKLIEKFGYIFDFLVDRSLKPKYRKTEF